MSVQVYSTRACAYCVRAKRLLEERGIPFEEIDVTFNHELRDWLVSKTGQRTVPQIFIHGEPIGGFQELHALDRGGELVKRLQRT